MKTRLLRQLRKDAKESIYIEYPSFKDACDNNFTDETPSMIIVTGINSAMMDLEDDNKDYALIDGVKFTFNNRSWQYESENISITKAKSLLWKIREFYVKVYADFYIEKRDLDRLHKLYDKDYKKFLRHIDSLND